MRAYGVAMFFLVAHACYKALMFLGAGSVIHGMHDEQDMREMGGLRRAMPWTFATFAIGGLAQAGASMGLGGAIAAAFGPERAREKLLEHPLAYAALAQRELARQ